MFQTEIPQQGIAISIKNTISTATNVLLEVKRISKVMTGHRSREGLVAPDFRLIDANIDPGSINVGTDHICLLIVVDPDLIHCLIGHKTVVHKTPFINRRLLDKSLYQMSIQTDMEVLVVVCLIARSIAHRYRISCTNGRIRYRISQDSKAL
jgi:hypothetical protein